MCMCMCMCITCTCVFEFVMIKKGRGSGEPNHTDHGDDHVTPAPLQSDLQLSMSLVKDVTLKGTTHPSWIAALPSNSGQHLPLDLELHYPLALLDKTRGCRSTSEPRRVERVYLFLRSRLR